MSLELPLTEKPVKKSNNSKLPWLKKSGLLLSTLVTLAYFSGCLSSSQTNVKLADLDTFTDEELAASTKLCPVGKTIRPSAFYHDNSSVNYIIYDEDYRLDSVHKLSGAVKIPTVVKDNMPKPEDDPEAWAPFPEFHAYLSKEFPLVHNQLLVEKVNTHGLVYTWKGSDPNLKPLLLTAHQDVVPVENGTRSDWKYPPFSGYFDGTNIWGRGVSDDKSMLIGTLQAVEKLLGEEFIPHRGVVLAFGFDEEVGGPKGAATIAAFLEKKYGPDSFHSLLDEGGTAISTIGGTVFAQPSVGEKGSMTLDISLKTPGGHSSVPPDHTNIGLISKLISYIEDHPFEPILGKNNPTLNFLQCVAKYSDAYDKTLRKNIFAAAWHKVANAKVLEYLDSFKAYKYLVRTTQAVDIIQGGVKDNALPEYVHFHLNHRISVESSVQETIDKVLGDVQVVADQYDLGAFYGDAELTAATEKGYFNVTVLNSLEPAKSTPLNDEVWELFAGSIKHIIEDYIYPNLTKPAIVSGSLNTGNTDTHYYWPLTQHIYRFRLSTLNGILEGGTHSVNEHTTIDNHLYLTALIYEYIRNVDEFGTD